jgi:hypothetical protein
MRTKTTTRATRTTRTKTTTRATTKQKMLEMSKSGGLKLTPLEMPAVKKVKKN